MVSDDTGFDERMDQYKKLIYAREEECNDLRALFRGELRLQTRNAIFCKSFLIIAGAVIVTKEVLEFVMLKLNLPVQYAMIATVIYAIIGWQYLL